MGVSIDARWWALGVGDAFHGRPIQNGVADQFSYTSGRVEGEAARQQGTSIDAVFERCKLPYRKAGFGPAPVHPEGPHDLP